MKTPTILILAALGVSHTIAPADAQQKGRQLPGTGTAPVKVGSELADVTAFTAEGEEFPLRQKLEGRHAVIVFGCLT